MKTYLTLEEQVDHAIEEIRKLDAINYELYSIALWGARRMATEQYGKYMYDEIEKVTGGKVDRDWRGKQV